DDLPLALHVAAAVKLFHLDGLAIGITLARFAKFRLFGGELLDNLLRRQISRARERSNRCGKHRKKNETTHRSLLHQTCRTGTQFPRRTSICSIIRLYSWTESCRNQLAAEAEAGGCTTDCSASASAAFGPNPRPMSEAAVILP